MTIGPNYIGQENDLYLGNKIYKTQAPALHKLFIDILRQAARATGTVSLKDAAAPKTLPNA